jgi:hypothetical protein
VSKLRRITRSFRRITRDFGINLEINDRIFEENLYWSRLPDKHFGRFRLVTEDGIVEEHRSQGWLPGEYFLAEFQAVWVAWPLNVRDTLLGYWRRSNRPLRVSLGPLPGGDDHEAEIRDWGQWLRFDSSHDEDLGLDHTRRSIALMLAHVYRCATIGMDREDEPNLERYERLRDKIEEDMAAMTRLYKQGKTASPEYQRLCDQFLRDREELERLEGQLLKGRL